MESIWGKATCFPINFMKELPYIQLMTKKLMPLTGWDVEIDDFVLHSALILLQSHPFVDGANAFFWPVVARVNIYCTSCLQLHHRNGRKCLLNVFNRTKRIETAGERTAGSVSCTCFEKHAHLLHCHLLWGSFAEGVSLVFSAVSLIFNFSMRFPRAVGSPF